MDRPLCPLCKTKHFAREPHEFKAVGDRVSKAKEIEAGGRARGMEAKVENEDRVGDIGTAVGKPKDVCESRITRLRTTRMVGRPRIYPDPKVRRKEYMREWRKRAKATSG